MSRISTERARHTISDAKRAYDAATATDGVDWIAIYNAILLAEQLLNERDAQRIAVAVKNDASDQIGRIVIKMKRQPGWRTRIRNALKLG